MPHAPFDAVYAPGDTFTLSGRLLCAGPEVALVRTESPYTHASLTDITYWQGEGWAIDIGGFYPATAAPSGIGMTRVGSAGSIADALTGLYYGAGSSYADAGNAVLPGGWSVSAALTPGPVVTYGIYDNSGFGGESAESVRDAPYSGPTPPIATFDFTTYYDVVLTITAPTLPPTTTARQAYQIANNYAALYYKQVVWEFPAADEGDGAQAVASYQFSTVPPASVSDPYQVINYQNTYDGVRFSNSPFLRGHFALGASLGVAPDGHTLRMTTAQGVYAPYHDFSYSDPLTHASLFYRWALGVKVERLLPGGSVDGTFAPLYFFLGSGTAGSPATPTLDLRTALSGQFAYDAAHAGDSFRFTPVAQGYDPLLSQFVVSTLTAPGPNPGYASGEAPPWQYYIGPPVLPAPCVYTPPPPASSTGSLNSTSVNGGVGFAVDAHRRPAWGYFAGSSGYLLTTNDGGHTYSSHGAVRGAADANLLWDRRTNAPTLIYFDGAGIRRSRASLDGERADFPAGTLIAGIGGQYPATAQHPTDTLCAAGCYLSATNLKTALTYDGGLTWTPNTANAATGLDFTVSGRAGIAWVKETLTVCYWDGTHVTARTSLDRGQTWGTAATVFTPSTAPSYLSMQGFEGNLYLLVTVSGLPQVWVSAGGAWSRRPDSPVPSTLSGLGVLPQSGRLLSWIMQLSDCDGNDWEPA